MMPVYAARGARYRKNQFNNRRTESNQIRRTSNWRFEGAGGHFNFSVKPLQKYINDVHESHKVLSWQQATTSWNVEIGIIGNKKGRHRTR